MTLARMDAKDIDLKNRRNSMEHKIGEIVTLPDGRKAEVVEDTDLKNFCEGCIFNSKRGEWGCVNVAGDCSAPDRSDHKNIIYKEIKGK